MKERKKERKKEREKERKKEKPTCDQQQLTATDGCNDVEVNLKEDRSDGGRGGGWNESKKLWKAKRRKINCHVNRGHLNKHFNSESDTRNGY